MLTVFGYVPCSLHALCLNIDRVIILIILRLSVLKCHHVGGKLQVINKI